MHTCNINELHKPPPTATEQILNNSKIFFLPVTSPVHAIPKTILLPPKQPKPISILIKPTL